MFCRISYNCWFSRLSIKWAEGDGNNKKAKDKKNPNILSTDIKSEAGSSRETIYFLWLPLLCEREIVMASCDWPRLLLCSLDGLYVTVQVPALTIPSIGPKKKKKNWTNVLMRGGGLCRTKVIYLCSSIKHCSPGVFQSDSLINKFHRTNMQQKSAAVGGWEGITTERKCRIWKNRKVWEEIWEADDAWTTDERRLLRALIKRNKHLSALLFKIVSQLSLGKRWG